MASDGPQVSLPSPPCSLPSPSTCTAKGMNCFNLNGHRHTTSGTMCCSMFRLCPLFQQTLRHVCCGSGLPSLGKLFLSCLEFSSLVEPHWAPQLASQAVQKQMMSFSCHLRFCFAYLSQPIPGKDYRKQGPAGTGDKPYSMPQSKQVQGEKRA
jgi:hypothetical protein